MILTVSWLGQINGLVAIPGSVVISFTLGSVRVANVVSVVFLKFIAINIIFLSEFLLPVPK